MLTVAIQQAKFIAPVGLYPQEAVIHNELEVDLALSCPARIEELPFIDYVILHQLVKKHIMQGEKLLEDIVRNIVLELRMVYPDCKVSLSIRKCNPPMSGQVGSSSVSWED